MELGQLLLGQIPEALYFTIFMIFVKQLKEKKILFTLITIIEYALLFNLFKDSYVSHIIFFIFTYCLLKILYKEKMIREADTPEAKQVIRKYLRRINQMR